MGRRPRRYDPYDGSGGERHIPSLSGDQSKFYAGIEAALRGAAPNPVPPVQAVAVVAVIEAAILAARSGQATVPELTAEERVISLTAA
jgi:hypothetical protein